MKDDRTFQEVIEDFVETKMKQTEYWDPNALIDLATKTYGEVLLSKFVPDKRGRNTLSSWQEVIRETHGIIYCDAREEQDWEMRGGRD